MGLDHVHLLLFEYFYDVFCLVEEELQSVFSTLTFDISQFDFKGSLLRLHFLVGHLNVPLRDHVCSFDVLLDGDYNSSCRFLFLLLLFLLCLYFFSLSPGNPANSGLFLLIDLLL